MSDLRYSAIVALLCVSTAAYAQETVFVIGTIGQSSCGQYLSAVHNEPPGRYRTLNHPQEGKYYNEHTRYLDWVMGFLTGMNLSSVRTGGRSINTDTAAIDVWFKRWCEQNPTKQLFEAAWAFIEDQRR